MSFETIRMAQEVWGNKANFTAETPRRRERQNPEKSLIMPLPVGQCRRRMGAG
jgi:hypothetical protein